MMKRETAMKSVNKRQIEAPEKRCELDYYVGDVVQLKAGKKYGGRVGIIIGIRLFTYQDGIEDLAYTVKLSDHKSVEVSARRINFIRHGDAPDPEEG